ncbi:AAA family ATPase [Carboxylicivirga marina]|uniref:AAA family ATPase n=1 Tax=Carboxylicivirga marina TaxID=2800988 RepID=UPI0025951287|nr:AAA family ATPase [uncultured Carboxylicivirga sp.]
MISKVSIKNLKALKDITLSTSPLNIFTGLNGMGKSTVMQSLLLFRQSRNTEGKELKLHDSILQLGSFEEVFCEAAEDEKLKIQIEWSNKDSLQFEAKYVTSLKDEKIIKNSINSSLPVHQSLFKDSGFVYLSSDRIVPADSYDTNDSLIKNHQLGISGEFAPHFYQNNKNIQIPIKELSFDGDDEASTLEVQVNKWLSIISPGVKVHTEEQNGLIVLKYSYVTQEEETSKFRAKNAGFGLTYVFSVLVALLSANKGDLVIIENPEANIHPKGQTQLARLMALAAKNGVQIFVETHSDHIIYGTRIAIKERNIDKEEVRIYYLGRDKKEHFSKAYWIEIDEYGRIEREVREYFDEFESHLNRLM